MIPCLSRISSALVIFATVLGTLQQTVHGQTVSAPLDRGFVRSSSIVVSVDEMLGTRSQRAEGDPIIGPGYPALWIAEVQFKPPRLLRMPVTDPATGRTDNELVWYMVYRVIPRDYADLAGSEEARELLLQRLSNEATDPQNDQDEVMAPNLIVPRFVLQTLDEGAQQSYLDEINNQVRDEVLRREFRGRASRLRLLNSIEAISDVKKQVRADDPDALNSAVYGVAVWRDVDPETDFFRIEMYGFTNAYRLMLAEDGSIRIEDKCIVQSFRRPGDRFRQEEVEFRVDGDPEWIYQPRDATLDIPEAISILRNNPAIQ